MSNSAIPQGKISATILDFGAPVIGLIAGQAMPIEALNSMFQVIITVWNAHVMATPTWGQPEHLADLRNTVAGAPPEMALLINMLSERRVARFADDPRAVGEWSVIPDKTNLFTFRCDARMPPRKA